MGFKPASQNTPSAATDASTGIQACFRLDYPRAKNQGFSLDVDIQLPGQGVSAIFGHSGSGKTTLLRCIAGLERPPTGSLSINGECWQRPGLWLPTHKRALGYVFQEASLFPHLTAAGNLPYALKRSGQPLAQARYRHILDTLGIGAILSQYPQQLSGGERQRVAIARALLLQPRVLLMDEPLASLDGPRKAEILPYLERLHRSTEIPIIYVSHALDEVTRLADHLCLLEQGRVLTSGPLNSVLSRLDTPLAVSEEAGVMLEGEVMERDNQWHLARIRFADGEFWVRDDGDGVGSRLRLRILARDISLTDSPDANSSILNRLPVTVKQLADPEDAAMVLVQLQVGTGNDNGGSQLVARITRRSAHQLELAPGRLLWAQIKSVAIVR